MPTTIKDIAKAVGCSPSTVSRALSDHPQINENTKRAIRLMAKKMNFRINQTAAGLRKHKTAAIGVIVPNISNYFFSSILSGIEHIASKSGYQVLICQTNESMREEAEYVKSLSAGRVDGILVSISESTNNYKHLKELRELGIPLVLFDRTADKVNAFRVEAEDELGAFNAVQHLIKTGCKKIAYLAGPENLINSQNRLKGYQKALKQHGLAVKSSLVRVCGFSQDKVRQSIVDLLSGHTDIDGLFAANDIMAVEAILTLKSMGYRIPDQISVVGFGDYPIATIVEPALTTVSHNAYEIGYKAAERIMNEIENKIDPEQGSRIEIASQLVLRDSTRKLV